MKSIPSLVATSTVGVAATGLVFGRSQPSTSTYPASNKRKAVQYDIEQRLVPSPQSRPPTSSSLASPNPEEAPSFPISASTGSDNFISIDRSSQVDDSTSPVLHLNSSSRRRDILSSQDHGVRGRRDSLSSRNSWIRRLSVIQVSSHQGSPRSSIGPDSPSLTFSHGSTAPILDTAGSPTPLPPNKLVKRTTSGILSEGEVPIRIGSKSQVPTLRRPATSHQRSVTLQQQLRRERTDAPDVLLQHNPPSQTPQRVIIGSFPPPDSQSLWRLYFESRSSKLVKERPSAKSSDSSIDPFYSTSRRIILPEGSGTPYLLKPTMITEFEDKTIPSWMETLPARIGDPIESGDLDSPETAHVNNEEPPKLPRRSLSMNFTSPTTWIPRSSSLRATKRANAKMTSYRYSSAPITPLPARAATSAHGTYGSKPTGTMESNLYRNQNQETGRNHDPQSSSAVSDIQTQTRNDSSPLPPLSRLSSFNIDSTRLGLSSPSSSVLRHSPISPNDPDSPPTVPTKERTYAKLSPKVVIHQDVSASTPEAIGSDKASTLIGSDSENRGFASGEEDETDFQSDTVFDSYRTGTTGSIRARNPPLEMMFDDSPPNNGHKIKTTVVRDMTTNGTFRESIVEEDEEMITPIKHRRALDIEGSNNPSTPVREETGAISDDVMRSSPPKFSLGSKEFARLASEDDDDDEDWTKDDDCDTISNPLSPPSSSINSQRVSSAIRNALAEATKTGPSGTSSQNATPGVDRPRSLFDWSEPLTVEKVDVMGNSPRPKTVHGKQIVDGRGGRAVGRRGPNALHVRSQSVPVVPDVTGHREYGKLAPKFGTWGLGGKGANEDWDNDFDFDGADVDENDNTNDSMSGSGMLVPEAIQASQANVVGHVGQIREVCLLVEDLKRLRSLAREKGILDGSSATLWREAEGIIALAIPDEEDETLSPPRSPSSYSFEHEPFDRYRNGSVDIEDLSEARNRTEGTSIHERATGLVYDGLHLHRQSVFSPEDDIFGAGGSTANQLLAEERLQSVKAIGHFRSKGSTDVARSVMEQIHQHRAASDPLRSEKLAGTQKMPFDTTSLRDLVHRANALSRALAEIIRVAEGSSHSPPRSPKIDLDSSPAFTRVFADPRPSSPKHLIRSQSNNSVLSSPIDASPTRGLEKRMHMMTVV